MHASKRPASETKNELQPTSQQAARHPASAGEKSAVIRPIAQLVTRAEQSAPVQALDTLQRRANTGVVQHKGTFIGDPAACHLHIDIASPHFKLGTNQRSRKDFGADYKLSRMQLAYDEIKEKYSGKTGYDACIAWLEENGCS